MPMWTPDEWIGVANVCSKAPALGLLASIILILFLIFTKELVNSHMVLMYAIISLVVSAQSCNFHASTSTFEDRVCYDKTRYIDQEQGPSTCVNQGMTIVYTFLAAVAVLCLLSIEWTLRTSGYQWATRTWWFFLIEFVVVYLLPIIPTAYASSVGAFGFSKAQGWCYIRSTPYAPENLDVGSTGIPVLIVFLITHMMLISCGIMWFMRKSKVVDVSGIKPASRSKGHDHSQSANIGDSYFSRATSYLLFDPWRPVDVSGKSSGIAAVALIIFSLFFTLPFLARMGGSYENRDIFADEFTDWVSCIFSKFQGTDDSWMIPCGEYPQERPSLALMKFNCVALTAHSIIILPVYSSVYILSFLYFQIYGGLNGNKVEADVVQTMPPSSHGGKDNKNSDLNPWNLVDEDSENVRSSELVELPLEKNV